MNTNSSDASLLNIGEAIEQELAASGLYNVEDLRVVQYRDSLGQDRIEAKCKYNIGGTVETFMFVLSCNVYNSNVTDIEVEHMIQTLVDSILDEVTRTIDTNGTRIVFRCDNLTTECVACGTKSHINDLVYETLEPKNLSDAQMTFIMLALMGDLRRQCVCEFGDTERFKYHRPVC